MDWTIQDMDWTIALHSGSATLCKLKDWSRSVEAAVLYYVEEEICEEENEEVLEKQKWKLEQRSRCLTLYFSPGWAEIFENPHVLG